MPSDQNRIVRRLVVAGMAAICMFVAASVTTAQTLWAQEIIVTTTDDDFDTNDGACSLREAVINANDNAETYADCATPPGADTIVLSAGTYEIDRTPGSGAASRDLDITAGRPITVLGASAATTVIEIDLNAHISARAFDVFAGANLTLADLTITGGNLPNDSSGAAVRVQTDASLTVRRVIFEDNLARDDGGAIDNRGTVTIYDSIFRENEASDNGGAVDNAGTLTVAGSLFVANDANDRGGAIHNTGTAEITNTTFSANRVLNGSDNRGGGAINNEDSGQMSLAFTSLIGNSANGSAIGSSITSRSGTVAVIASVIASDETDNCATRASGAITSGGYNIDSGSSCNFASTGDLSSTDPLVGALVNAGGLTDVHPLQANSPAIDIVPANTAGCGSTVVADQRGESRPQDGNADNTAACDAGAYEVTGQVTGVGGVDPIDVTVLTTVINSGNGPLSNPTQPLGPNPVNAGETYRFFVEIENLDPVDPAYGVIVHDTLLGLVGATVNEIIPADGWSCSFGGSQLLCSYTGPLLGNGQPAPVAEVTLTIDPAQPNSTITHYLQASTLNPDTDLTNNACDIADDCVTFDVQGQADLAINKRALTPSAAPGGFLLYEIEVINNGPSRLPSATVTDTISSGPGVVVAASPNCTIGAQTVCTVTDLEVGERRDLLVTVQVDAGAASGQSITNCATVEDVPSGVNQSGANQSCDTATVVAPLVDADLQVTSVNLTSGPFTPGAVERIELQVANLSAAAAQGVLVTFACDAVGSFEIANLSTPTDGTNPLWSHSSGGTFARIATLPGNSSETLAFDLRAPANAHYTAAGLIEDCRATVAAINPDPNLANNSNTIGNTFDSQAQANLSLTKTLLTPNVAAGGTAVYAVNLCNAGPSDVRGLSLVDTLGANLAPGSLVSSADLADLAVPAGQCVDVLITAQVTANAAPGTSFENSAQVTVDAAAAAGSTTLAAVVNQPTAGPVIGQVAVALAPADIQATNTITDLTTPIVAGQSYQFQIGIENAGPAQAQGVTVHDLLQGLPTGWSVTAIQTDPNWACSAGLTCTRSGAMPVKAETVATVTVQIPAQTAAGIYSHQLAAAADNPDGDLSNNDAEYPFNVVTTVDLGLTIGNLGQPLVIGGGALLYPVVVSNNGPSAAANVVVDVAVPAGLSLDALVAGGFVACTSNLAAGTGQCTIPTVGAGDAVTFYAAVRAGTAAATGSVQAITAEIASVTSTNNNLPVTDAATTRVDAVADVTVSKTGPASVTVGGSAVYNLIVSNNGPSPATGVRVTDTLPSLMGFVSATGATCSATGNVVTCAPFDLAAGTAQQITITASVAANVCYSGSVTNYVEVGGDRYVSDTGNNPSSPPSSANNQAQWTTQLAAEANLAITKSVLNSPVTAGGLAEFLIEITNNGPGCAPNVIVVDELNGNGNPEGLTQAAYFATESTLGDGNGPFAGAYYACTSGICRRGEALPAGMSDTIRILARVPADTTAGDYINQVNVFTNDRLISANPLPSPIVQTSVADFASCGITDDVVIVDNTGGEIQLRYQIDDDFDAGPLDANQWTGLTVTPPGPYVPTFDNGAVVLANGAGVSGARIRSNMTFLYRTVEGRVRFTDAFEQIVGFSNFSGSWAVISTYRDTSRLHAWSNGPDGEQVTPLPFSIDPFAFHDYRVVWGDSAIEYWIDGVLVATHNRAITTPMFAHVTNWYGQGTQVVTVDNMRVLDYATPGQFTSCAIDAREPVSWTNLSWLGQTPTDTALQAAVRTSDDGATWSAWTPVTNGGGSSDAPARYLQYRFDFSAANTLVTPRLDEVSIGFERPGGQPATINLASAYATAPWTVTTAADLAIAKTLLTPGTVAPGGLLQYEIVVTNDGPSVATGINVTDTLTAGFPAGTQIVAASPECTGAPGTQITCAVDNLWPGQSLDFLVTVRVGIAAANGATIENCAAVNDLPNGINQACAASATVGNLLPNADIEIISMSCSPVLPGSPDTETVCSVTFNNSGPATASNVTLAQRAVNVIPQGQSFSAVTSQQSVNVNTLWLCSTGMDCTRTAPMPAGTTDTVTLHFRTLPDAHLNAFDGRPIRVEASVTASNPDASLFNNRVIVAPDVQPSANLRVDKVALTENPAPGGAALFAVTVYNDGFSDVAGVAIDDVITTGNATILSVSPAGTAYIAAGSSQQFLVAVQVDDDALPGDTVTNQATVNVLGVDDGLSTLVTATGYNGTINDPQTDTASITVGGQLPDADISAGTITNNTAPIVAGGLYSFTVSVSNAGPAQAQGVVVHNLLLDLPGATLVNVTPAPNWFCSGDLTCTRQDPLLPQISETVATVTVTIPANTPAGIYRHRLAASSSNPDPVLSNNSTEAYTFEVTTAAALTITVDDLDEPLVAGGAPVIYPIQVYNSGPSDAYDVDLTVTLQPGFVLVSLDEGDLPMTCAVGTASCTVPSVPAGGSRTLYAGIRAAASAPPTLPPAGNSPVVEVCITDAANAATPVCDSENTRVDARADLVLSKQASATVNAGDTITYTVDVFNAGPSDAQNVQVIDTLPAGVTVENADLCTENAGVLTCPAISLAAGTSQRYSFLVRTDPSARPGSSLENVAEVTSDTADLNTLNNRDDADTSIVSLAALSVTKTPSAATVNAGESIRFDIIVTNAGPSTAQNVTVEDALPAGLSLVEASVDFGGGVQPCGGVVCGVGDLAAGAFATVRITALAAADLAAGTTLTNVAQVNSDSAENDLADNRAEAPVTVTTQAQITVSKTDLLDPVVRNDAPGVDDLAYVLTVANNGPSAAASVRVTDTLPTGVVGEAFVLSASWAPGPQPGTCSGAGELVCELGAIPAGEQVQIYVRADIQDPLLCDADVTNQAAAAWTVAAARLRRHLSV